MGKPAYISTNLAADAISVTATNLSAPTVYLDDYINDEILATTTRFTGLGGHVTFDISASPFVDYNTVFIGNHNLNTGGSFNVYTGTSLLSLGFVNLATLTANGVKNTWIALGSQTPKNYVQVQIVPPSLMTYAEAGEIVIGPRVLLPRACTWDGDEIQENTGITNETLGGVEWDYELSHYGMIQPKFIFPQSERAAFLAFSDAVERTPFVYIPDVDRTTAYYVKKDRGFKPQFYAAAMDGSSMARWYVWTPTFRTQSEGIAVNS